VEVDMTHLGPGAHAVLRIVTGLLFMQHGAQKLFGWLGGVGGSGVGVPLVSQMGLAGVLEFAGGTLLVIGLFARPVAALLLLEMIVAYLQAHMPKGPWPMLNGGELALLYAGIFTFLAGAGAGPVSADAAAPVRVRRERRYSVHDRRAHSAA
jgi:putative oxidoreductase